MSARSPRPTRADEVAETLKHRILSGVHAPGDKLPPELSLASELHVNRFTVREAMNKLEQLRLIARKPGAGTVVLDYAKNAGVDVIEYLVLTGDGVVNTEVLANLLEFARLLSSEISALAADRHSDEDLAALDVIVARMRSEKNLSKLLWLDFEFNWTLCGAARNLVPRLLMNSVRELLEKYSHLLETLWVSPGSITQGYEHVVDAVRARRRASTLADALDLGRPARAFRRRGTPRQPASARRQLVTFDTRGQPRATHEPNTIDNQENEHGDR